jgi:hypothetical protein
MKDVLTDAATLIFASVAVFLFPATTFAVTCDPNAVSNISFTDNGSGVCVGYLLKTSTSPWIVPGNWNNSNNTVELIGPGGGGNSAARGSGHRGGGGGSGGAEFEIGPGALRWRLDRLLCAPSAARSRIEIRTLPLPQIGQDEAQGEYLLISTR